MPVYIPAYQFTQNIKVLDVTAYTVVNSGSGIREIITLKFKDNFAARIAAPKS